jgi:hypothetical protein
VDAADHGADRARADHDGFCASDIGARGLDGVPAGTALRRGRADEVMWGLIAPQPRGEPGVVCQGVGRDKGCTLGFGPLHVRSRTVKELRWGPGPDPPSGGGV